MQHPQDQIFPGYCNFPDITTLCLIYRFMCLATSWTDLTT